MFSSIDIHLSKILQISIEYLKNNWSDLLVVSLFLPVYLINKFYKFKQLATLTGDSITHILFHNFKKQGLEINVCGVVGGRGLNLPAILYRLSSLIFPSYRYSIKVNLVTYSNLIFLTCLEIYIFYSVFLDRGLLGAFLALLCVGLIPSISILSWSEKGSYSKFSERFLALISNGVFVYYSLKIAFGSTEPSTIIITSISLISSIYLGKFSRQAVFFWTIFLLFFSFNISLLIPLLACGFVIIIDGDLRNEIFAQWIYLKNYKSYQAQNFEVSESTVKKIFPRYGLSEFKLLRVYMRLFLHSGVGILIMLPTAYFLFVEKYSEFQIIFYGTLFIAVLTTTHLLYFIGSGDRYMYHLVTIPAFILINNFGSSVPMIWVNGIIVIFYLVLNIRSIHTHYKLVKDKCVAYLNFFKNIGINKTVFFDHYKDGEIFQLVNGIYTDQFKTSTSRSYLWDEQSKVIFSSYPKISFEKEILSGFSVDFIISISAFCRSDLELIGESMGYKLYRVLQTTPCEASIK